MRPTELPKLLSITRSARAQESERDTCVRHLERVSVCVWVTFGKAMQVHAEFKLNLTLP